MHFRAFWLAKIRIIFLIKKCGYYFFTFKMFLIIWFTFCTCTSLIKIRDKTGRNLVCLYKTSFLAWIKYTYYIYKEIKSLGRITTRGFLSINNKSYFGKVIGNIELFVCSRLMTDFISETISGYLVARFLSSCRSVARS